MTSHTKISKETRRTPLPYIVRRNIVGRTGMSTFASNLRTVEKSIQISIGTGQNGVTVFAVGKWLGRTRNQLPESDRLVETGVEPVPLLCD